VKGEMVMRSEFDRWFAFYEARDRARNVKFKRLWQNFMDETVKGFKANEAVS
jgi:hypothetical protein